MTREEYRAVWIQSEYERLLTTLKRCGFDVPLQRWMVELKPIEQIFINADKAFAEHEAEKKLFMAGKNYTGGECPF